MIIQAKHLAQCLANSKLSINGCCCCCFFIIILFPICTNAIGTLHGQEVVEGGCCLHLGRCAWHGRWWGICPLGKGLGPDFVSFALGQECLTVERHKAQVSNVQSKMSILRFCLVSSCSSSFLWTEMKRKRKQWKHHRSTERPCLPGG